MAAGFETGPVDLLECLVEAKAGSIEASNRLFGQCHDYLLFIANRELSEGVRARVAASDLVQESLLKAHRHLGNFKGKTAGEFLAWLRQILIRSLLDARRCIRETECRRVERATRPERPSAVEGSGETPSVQMINGELQEALLAAIDRLPDPYRQVIVARIWERRSFGEIAENLNRTSGAVRMLWIRGIEQLRKDWRTDDGGRNPG